MKVLCTQCKKREASVFIPEYMRKYINEKTMRMTWAKRMQAGLPELCKPCDDKNWSS